MAVPATIPDSEIECVLHVAEALRAGDQTATERVRHEQIAAAHNATGYAENAIQFLCALGLAKDALEVAAAYFLGRGFVVPSVRFPKGQGTYTRPSDRRTWFLFYPVTAPIRQETRCGALVRAIGLERYWKEAGVQPDYRRA